MTYQTTVTAQLLCDYYLSLPHCQAIQLQLVSFIEQTPIMKVPFQAALMADQDSQTMHGGIVCTLIDVASAASVTAKMPEVEGLATVDMRIDYLAPAKAKQDIYCQAVCFDLNNHNNIAFVRASCYQDDVNHPFAIATATFIRTKLTTEQKVLLA